MYEEQIEPMMRRRTRRYGLEVIRVVQSLKRGLVADVLARQLVRSGTSVGANYRSACRARSKADMAAKLAIAEEEADESLYWIDLLVESGELRPEVSRPLSDEGEEILRILVASIKTLKVGPKQTLVVREGVARYRAESEPERAEAIRLMEDAVLSGKLDSKL